MSALFKSSTRSGSKSRAAAEQEENRRNSTPLQAPFIAVEDATLPLTLSEDSHTGTPPVPSTIDLSHGLRINNVANGTANAQRRRSTWNPKKRSPNVGWKKRWDQWHNAFRNGRVLIVDCYSREFSDDGKRKTAAYEFADLQELEDFYLSDKGNGDGQCLRVIHVQNSNWARDFLLKKFNISSQTEDVVGTAFGKWVKYDEPQIRANKPVLNSKSFRNVKDPWRGVSRTGFGVDYLKSFRPGVIKQDAEPARRGFKLMDLNHWDEENATLPVHGYDVYVQRLSVYIQRKEGSVNLHPLNTDLRNPYIQLAYESPQDEAARKESVHLLADGDHAGNNITPGIPKTGSLPLPKDWEPKVLQKLNTLDNGTTIIVFESSHTGRCTDTLIQAREEIEVRWRRLMLYLNKEEQSEDRLGMECLDLVLRDIFKGLQASWDRLLYKCEAHISILEDKVYENPADESRAPELWSNSAVWLKLEKLLSLHSVTVKDIQQQMRDLSESDDHVKEDWIKDTPGDLEQIAKLFDEEMIKPTANLSDLLYKSIGIRDSRHSLQLGTSMWRLSWITFVFLPLTFISGFFGMNVDVFQPADNNYPGLKWYFIVAIPLMLLIGILYVMIKNSLSTSRDVPMERGVYEQIYNRFAHDHPHLWSRVGPRSYVKPRGFFAKIKWRLVKSWFDPSRTIARKTYTDIDEMGLWAKIKRHLAQRWLAQIEAEPGSGVDDEEAATGDFSTVTELLQLSAPVAMADAWPTVADAPFTPPLSRVFRPNSSRGSSHGSGHRRDGSTGSDMVVEEEIKTDDEDVGGGGDGVGERRVSTSEPTALERLRERVGMSTPPRAGTPPRQREDSPGIGRGRRSLGSPPLSPGSPPLS